MPNTIDRYSRQTPTKPPTKLKARALLMFLVDLNIRLNIADEKIRGSKKIRQPRILPTTAPKLAKALALTKEESSKTTNNTVVKAGVNLAFNLEAM